jgi:hypothetical protein
VKVEKMRSTVEPVPNSAEYGKYAQFDAFVIHFTVLAWKLTQYPAGKCKG